MCTRLKQRNSQYSRFQCTQPRSIVSARYSARCRNSLRQSLPYADSREAPEFAIATYKRSPWRIRGGTLIRGALKNSWKYQSLSISDKDLGYGLRGWRWNIHAASQTRVKGKTVSTPRDTKVVKSVHKCASIYVAEKKSIRFSFLMTLDQIAFIVYDRLSISVRCS